MSLIPSIFLKFMIVPRLKPAPDLFMKLLPAGPPAVLKSALCLKLPTMPSFSLIERFTGRRAVLRSNLPRIELGLLVYGTEEVNMEGRFLLPSPSAAASLISKDLKSSNIEFSPPLCRKLAPVRAPAPFISYSFILSLIRILLTESYSKS